MKNISRFVTFVSILACASMGGGAYAQDLTLSSLFDAEIRTGISIGAMIGESHELVYLSSQGDALMSELIWPFAPLYYWGASLNGQSKSQTKPGYFFSFAVKSGLPAITGRMTDRDWLGSKGELTHFSAHDGHTEGALFADLRLGLSFPVFGWFSLRPSVTLSHMHLSWTAQDGYVQYGPNVNVYPYVPWREDFEKIPVYGTGIAYTQAWNILSVGIGVSKRILPHLELQAGTSLSPVVYCEDQDDHFLRLVQFNETMTGGRGIEPFASASYSFGDSAVLRLEYSYRYLDRVRGTTKITKIGSGQTLGTMTDGAGAAYGVHDVGLTLMVRL